jgi:histidinol dehydrogenase
MRLVDGRRASRFLDQLAAARAAAAARVEPTVARVVDDVRRNGDRALKKYAARWDGLKPRQSMRVPPEEIRRAWDNAPEALRTALQTAASNIRRFCEWQKPTEWRRTLRAGVSIGQLVRPLDSVGCYVPGGRYPLPSTLLMTVTPARVAGVSRIVVVSPRPAPETLAAAALMEVDEVYRIGGAQSVAALAYGTRTIPAVEKIVGPGNLFVTMAKKRIAFDRDIDFLAGPTEVTIVSDDGNPDLIAADLVAQAEHDPDAAAIFITTSRRLADAVRRQAQELARGNEVAAASLQKNGMIVLAPNRAAALELANAIAPEHLTVSAEDLPHVRNAGSVFVGDYSPQASGDYVSGPNHVLPTGGRARVRGGLSVTDFVKVISVQELTERGLRQLAPTIERLAEAEGLHAHADSVRIRFRKTSGSARLPGRRSFREGG